MRKSLILPILILLQLVSTKRMTALDYMASGYNIYEANPLTTTNDIDPGFKTARIFDFTYKNSGKSDDGLWEVPDYIEVIRSEECSLDFNKRIITGPKLYRDVLSGHIDYSFDDKKGIFKGNKEFIKLESNTNSKNDIYTASEAQCNVYIGMMENYPTPKGSANFLKDVKNLPILYEYSSYMDFLNKYGTHYIYMVYLGSKFGCVNRITGTAWKSFLMKGYEAKDGVIGSCLERSEAKNEKIHYNKEAVEELKRNCLESNITITGPHPVKGEDDKAWLKTTLEDPKIIGMKLRRISSLLDTDIISDDEEIEIKKTNINTALNEYCGYLYEKSKVSGCRELIPDRKSVV